MRGGGRSGHSPCSVACPGLMRARSNVQGTTQSVLEYSIFHDALVKVGTPMVYGIWSVGRGKPWAWAPKLGHYYRTAGDLGNRWGQTDTGGPAGGAGVMYNYDIQQVWRSVAPRPSSPSWTMWPCAPPHAPTPPMQRPPWLGAPRPLTPVATPPSTCGRPFRGLRRRPNPGAGPSSMN